MSDDDKTEVITAQESEDLKGLLDLGKQALITFAEQGESQSKLASQQLQFAEKRLEVEKTAFKFKFTAVIIFIIGLFAIIMGLIFAKDDVNSGLLILSHVVALLSGAFAGWGWQKGQQ